MGFPINPWDSPSTLGSAIGMPHGIAHQLIGMLHRFMGYPIMGLVHWIMGWMMHPPDELLG